MGWWVGPLAFAMLFVWPLIPVKMSGVYRGLLSAAWLTTRNGSSPVIPESSGRPKVFLIGAAM